MYDLPDEGAEPRLEDMNDIAEGIVERMALEHEERVQAGCQTIIGVEVHACPCRICGRRKTACP